MSDWVVPIVWLIVVAFSMIGGVTVGRLLSQRFMDWRQDRSEYTLEKADGHPDSLELFCSDCGKKYGLTSVQDGFDRATGKPKLSYRLRCPDFTMAAYNKAMSSYTTSMVGMYMLGHGPSTKDCGTRMKRTVIAVHDHDQDKVSTDCPTCVNEMFSNGALDAATANKLLVKAGVS